VTHAVVRVTLPHAWQYIRTIRAQVRDALKDCDSARRAAAVMTASELLENAIKYGEDLPGASSISFALTAEGEWVCIEVSNGSADREGIRELQRRVDDVARASDRAALYMARLEELLAKPTESGRLGLYRIAFEGQFDLQCRYTDNLVTVIATRGGR
jgi:anti-sigma regulatory factor (Ser/Thr protein kinase)